MRSIQRFCISRPITTAMFYLGLVLMGAISLSRLKLNLLPELEYPRVTVVTLYGNAAPEEIENLITKPISEAVSTVSSIEKVESVSLEGISVVTLQFSWGSNVDFSVMEVREKIDLIRGNLPQDAGRSIVTRFDPAQSPFMDLAIFPAGLQNPKDLRTFVKNEVKVYLDRVDGVAMAQLAGGYRKEVHVDVDPQALAGYSLTLDAIKTAIANANLNYPAGHVTVGSKDVLVRSLGEYRSSDDIKQTIVGRNDSGIPVALASVAEVSAGYRDRTGLARYNGKECVLVSLYKGAGKNTVDVSQRVQEELGTIRQQFGKEIKVEMVYDESQFIRNSVNSLLTEILFGGALAFVALIFILRNLRNPIILLTVVPTSIFTTFSFMYMFGISMNMMSLGGLELTVGMLFDSGNVVLSAIQRHIGLGLSLREAALKGGSEVTGSITSAILTTVIVFLPIVFLKSVVGVVFAEMALTISISNLVSLVVSLTLIPMLCSLRLTGLSRLDVENVSLVRKFSGVERKLTDRYEILILRYLNAPRKLLYLVMALFAGALCLTPFVQREFIPKVDTGEFSINAKNPRGSSLRSTADVVEELEKTLAEDPRIEHVISRIGYEEDQIVSQRTGDVGTHLAELRVVLKEDRNTTAKKLAMKLGSSIKLKEDTDVFFHVRNDILSSLLSPDARGVSLDLSGDDLKTLSELGNQIALEVGKIKGVSGVSGSMEDKAPEYHVTFDDVRMAKNSFDHTYLARYLSTAIGGTQVTSLHIGDEQIDVRVRFREQDRKNIEQIESISLESVGGGKVYLSQIANVTATQGYTSVLRSGATRINRISADIDEGKTNSVMRELDRYIGKIQLPEGYSIKYAGERENISRSFKELLFAFLLSTVLIYMLLAAQFESLKFPIVMLSTIPLIVIGVVPALALTGKSLNISSFTGLILLLGIVVDNASLFYEYVEILLADGFDLRTAIIDSCKIVLKPILMNNGTTMLGMLPLALELGQGSEFQSPMAITVISGLIASVFLSLFVIPVAFYQVLKRSHAAEHS